MKESCKKIILVTGILGYFHHHTIIASSQKKSWPIITRQSRSTLPADLLAQAQDSKLSVFKPSTEDLPLLYKNYPDGSLLFPQHNDLALKFNNLIQTIKANPDLIEFLRKIQIKSLNQIYAYIIKIYTNLNLTNPGVQEGKDGNLQANRASYLADEAQYDLNKKKLIMNHFLNIIQAQFSASVVAYCPKIPADIAVAFGQMFIENDYGINLNEFTKPQTDTTIIAQQTKAMKFLEQYTDFYQTYTNFFTITNPTGITEYCNLAQYIQNYLTNPNNSMNPSMFFYDIESMRAIQFIPFVANSLKKNTKLIPWAPAAINAATKNLTMNGHEIAYFKDASGKKTQSLTDAKSLYLLTEVGSALFEEEILAQPGWLNNPNGCIKILSACLGNFAALIGMGILDETLETILQKALGISAGPTNVNASTQTKQIPKMKNEL